MLAPSANIETGIFRPLSVHFVLCCLIFQMNEVDDHYNDITLQDGCTYFVFQLFYQVKLT